MTKYKNRGGKKPKMKGRFTVILITTIFLSCLAYATPASAAPIDVVINEIMQNPSAVADANGEWFELFNAGSSGVDINGWTIQDNGFDTHLINNGGPLVIPAGGYLVLGNNADSGTNGGVTVDYSYGSSWYLGNSGDEIVLLNGTLNEVDRVEYDGGATFPDPSGASMALSNPALDNNIGGNWCTASTPYGDGDLGTPGTANDCVPPPEPPVPTPAVPSMTLWGMFATVAVLGLLLVYMQLRKRNAY